MRLSLRTLLAFADNIYDSESRRLVEARINEQQAASSLLQRIRDVTHSAHIEAPGDEFSPNLTAAYLDHFLSDEETNRFETLVVKSDPFLAETVACHNILTSILGKPTRISRGIRQLLYEVPTVVHSANSADSAEPQQAVIEKKRKPLLSREKKKSKVHESLRNWERKRSSYYLGITLFSIFVFVAIFAVNILIEPSVSQSHVPQTGVDVSPLLSGTSHEELFEQNRVVFEKRPSETEIPASPVTPTVIPMMEMQLAHDLQMIVEPPNFTDLPQSFPSFPSFSPVLPQPQTSQPASSGKESTVAPDDANRFAQNFNQSFPRTSETPGQNQALTMSHAVVDPWETPLDTTPVPLMPPTPLIQPTASERLAVPKHLPVALPESSPTTISISSPTTQTQQQSQLQISSVGSGNAVSGQLHSSQEKEKIFSGEPQNSAQNKIQVVGNVPSVSDLINRPLPPLAPQKSLSSPPPEKVYPPPDSSSHDTTSSEKSPTVTFPENFPIDYPVQPVSYLKHSITDDSWLNNHRNNTEKFGDLQHSMTDDSESRATTLKLTSGNMAFAARNENSYWERGITGKSLKNEYFLVPAPFQAVVDCANGLELTIHGDTRIRFLHESEGIAFDYGRIGIRVGKTDDLPIRYRIETPSGSGLMTFHSGESTVYLDSLDRNTHEYHPHFVILPGRRGNVQWLPDRSSESSEPLDIRVDSMLFPGADVEEILSPLDLVSNNNDLLPSDKKFERDFRQTELTNKLCEKLQHGATLETTLEEFLQDSSPEIRFWGCRWGAELGRMDVPVKKIASDDISPEEREKLTHYLNDVRSRDPESVKRLNAAEKNR